MTERDDYQRKVATAAWEALVIWDVAPARDTPTCVAYMEDGTICRAPARIVDVARGGMVCPMHAPAGQ